MKLVGAGIAAIFAVAIGSPDAASGAAATARPPSDRCVIGDDGPFARCVWETVRSGKVVDIDGGVCSGLLRPGQRTSMSILQDVLRKKQCLDQVPPHGIQTRGALFSEEVDLSDIVARFPIRLTRSHFDKGIKLSGATIGHSFSLDASTFGKAARTLDFESATIGGSVVLGDFETNATKPHKVLLPGINLSRVRVDGDIRIRNAEIQGKLDVGYARIKGGLDIREIAASQVSVYSTEIGGQLIVVGSELVAGPQTANQFRPYVLNVFSTRVDQSVILSRSVLIGLTILQNLRIGDSLILRGVNFRGDVDLSGTVIGGQLDLGAACRNGIRRTSWAPGMELQLTDAKVRTIRTPASDLAWASKINFVRFEFGGFYFVDDAKGCPESPPATVQPPAAWYISLLSRGAYSAQSYTQLQKLLKDSGEAAKAEEVGFKGKVREQREAWKARNYGDWFWLSASRAVIGFGYNMWLSAAWAAAFVVLGAFIFVRAYEIRHAGLAYALSYSFDMLLPLVKLRESHYRIDIEGRIRYYLYFHKLVGYFLASFLVAGVSGITK